MRYGVARRRFGGKGTRRSCQKLEESEWWSDCGWRRRWLKGDFKELGGKYEWRKDCSTARTESSK
jgi:hypothetical protein